MIKTAEPHFVRLPSDVGFPYKLLPPRIDQWALEAAQNNFGKDKVDGILSTLHRSEISYDAMVDDLMGYDRVPVASLRADPVYQLTLQTVRADLGSFGSIIPLTMGAVPTRDDFPNAKSPGLPYKLDGYRTKREVLDDGHLHDINGMWQSIGFRRGTVVLPDVCLFARAQIARSGKNKIRATWGYPLAVYLEEGRFFYPIQDFIKAHSHNFPIAYGFETAHGGMAAIHEMIVRNPGARYVCTDWSSFDKTIPPWLIRDVFSIIGGLIDWTRVKDAEGKIWDVRPDPSKRRWKRMVDYFVSTPIRTCKGERFLVSTGVPSGSCWTNLVDSLVNAIVTRYCFYQTVGCFPRDEIFLGDDGVVITSGVVNLEDIAGLALLKFGMVLNVAKSYVTTMARNVHFLGYFNYDGFPFKNQDFLIASFVQPEHSRTTVLEACAAALGQLWSGFDAGYAAIWFGVIIELADREGIGVDDVALHLRQTSHRHKYLNHVGLNPKDLSVPVPRDGLILEVVPPLNCARSLRIREYDIASLWHDVLC